MAATTINLKRRFLWTASAAGLLIAVSLISTPPAQGQFGIELAPILAMMHEVQSVMSNTITPILSNVNSTETNMRGFQQTVMYPEAEIRSFQSLAPEMLGRMTASGRMFSSPVNSAELANPQALESTLLSANPNSVGSVSSSYTKVYGALPPSSTIDPNLRNVIDMNDADAEDGMKLAVKLDAMADTEETLSKQYIQQLGSTAPGNAALIEAQAAAWNLQANAYTEQALDELLRLDAARTAYRDYEVKAAAGGHQNALGTLTAPIQ